MRSAYFALLSLTLVFLVGCQSVATLKNNVIDNYQVLKNQKPDEVATVSCSASLACHFFSVDGVRLLDQQGRATSQALEKGLLRLDKPVFSLGQQYGLSLNSGQHEVEVRFYPVSLERAERFHLIHYFKAGSQYRLVMFRQKEASGGKLINVAAPGALCVDLLRDDVLTRRFCRGFDALTGLGEFVEKKI